MLAILSFVLFSSTSNTVIAQLCDEVETPCNEPWSATQFITVPAIVYTPSACTVQVSVAYRVRCTTSVNPEIMYDDMNWSINSPQSPSNCLKTYWNANKNNAAVRNAVMEELWKQGYNGLATSIFLSRPDHLDYECPNEYVTYSIRYASCADYYLEFEITTVGGTLTHTVGYDVIEALPPDQDWETYITALGGNTSTARVSIRDCGNVCCLREIRFCYDGSTLIRNDVSVLPTPIDCDFSDLTPAGPTCRLFLCD